MMSRLQLALLDSDPYFGEMLSAYIRSSEFAPRFDLQRFTSREEGFAYLSGSKEPVIALIHESWLPPPDEVFARRTGCMLIVSETERMGGVLEFPVLFKYQPLNRMLAMAAAHYHEFCAEMPLYSDSAGAAQIIAVYSAIGGSGKTVTAVHLAAHLAAQGERVLCFSLERLPSYAWYEGPADQVEPDDTFSRLLYYARSRPELLPAKLEQAKYRHTLGRFDGLRPLREVGEWMELKPSDIKALLQAAGQSGLYDRIIVDSDSSDASAQLELLRQADLVLWPIADDCVQLRKTSDWMEAQRKRNGEEARRLLDKLRFLHNRNTGERRNDFTAYSITVSGQLPYVPEWKCVARVEEMLIRGFADDAAALVKGGGAVERRAAVDGAAGRA
ncbi:AAA domain-containing protein [Paenibacillus sp. UNCCL117]|uniref:nucleotide-binding protein n=1 Tax=unclassified Paenibacillus TaxID=185978 RepID=UPI0008828BA3|nr:MULTISPECIES: hypothetical protein [unclassified Paenibacillus]SDC47666.1 AAA domain-containing protein [Paenibacillus sp. cl123]SFW12086.1 AAA domain-containing protein [Paenibacillus sp. UNCCL117]